ERLESEYPAVAFRDMEFDIPAADHIKNLSECSNFRGLPFTVYFRKGKVAAATTSLQTEEQVREIIEREFS
ncbi:MAG: thioredoxin, partial [Spirochaetales bacterium]|nr:thioredoxin [Spirochaetales bacterium]